AEQGGTVNYETSQAGCTKYGPSYAAGLRRRRARLSDKWHLHEVQLKIIGKRHWLWRAVEQPLARRLEPRSGGRLGIPRRSSDRCARPYARHSAAAATSAAGPVKTATRG